MTKNLAKQNVKPSTETFDGYNVYEIGKSQYGEISNQFSIPSMASPQGNQTRVELTWPSSARYRVDDMFLNFTATNASATEAPSFKNIFCIFDKNALRRCGICRCDVAECDVAERSRDVAESAKVRRCGMSGIRRCGIIPQRRRFVIHVKVWKTKFKFQ